MRLGVIPQNVLEFLALRLGRVPTPVGDGLFTMMLSRTLMAAVRLGLFATLEPGALRSEELAHRLGADPSGVEALAIALVASGYLKRRGDRFANAPIASRWLVPSSPSYLGNLLLFNYDHWEWWSRLEDCLLEGRPVEIHQRPQTEEGVRRYVLAMRDLARLSAPEVVKLLPIPPRAASLLDVGGSHGAYAVALCHRHPTLSATVVDLEPVAAVGRSLVSEEGLGDRIAYRAADALRDDLGEGFDVALLFQLLHHFSPDEVPRLLDRVGGALRPGGLLALLEPRRDATPDQLTGLLQLHYFLTSRGGVYPRPQIEEWLAQAGFRRARPRRLRSAPGLELLLAERAP